MAELGKGRAFPSISDAQPVLTWVEMWTCPDPEVSAGIPSPHRGFYTPGCAQVLLGAAFTLILANSRENLHGDMEGTQEETNPVTTLLWDMYMLVGLLQSVCTAATMGQAFRLESLPPPHPPPPAAAQDMIAAGQEPARCQVSMAIRVSRSSSTLGEPMCCRSVILTGTEARGGSSPVPCSHQPAAPGQPRLGAPQIPQKTFCATQTQQLRCRENPWGNWSS